MNQLKKYVLSAIVACNIFIIAGFWWMGSSVLFTDVSGGLLALGRLTGLLAVYFVLLQFMLMGRAVWVERTFGLDKLARIHRLNGYLSILFILIHPLLIIFSYSMSGKLNFLEQFGDFLWNYEDVLSATIAAIIFLAVVFFSIYIVRKHLRYETWYYVHVLTYLAVLLAFDHQLKIGGDFLVNKLFVNYWYLLYVFVFGNVVVFRFLKPIYGFFRHRFTVDELVQETPDTISVYLKGNNMSSFRAEAGQFVIVRFLMKKLWTQAHPFSLSFLPKDDRIRVTIKSCGDFTCKICDLKKGTRVLVEGPYGTFTVPEKSTARQKFLFIAGGVGITPLRALIEKVAPDHDVQLLYSSKTLQDTIFKKELDELAATYHFPINYILTDQKDFAGEQGRLDQEKVKRLVKDVAEREVYICGPKPMIDSLSKAVQELGVKRRSVHFEKFAL